MIDTGSMIPIHLLEHSDPKDRLSLRNLAEAASDFLMSRKWCRRIRRGYLGIGFEGIVGVFFFEIEPDGDGVDSDLWVITGDVPQAYLVCDESPDACSALRAYIAEMRKWVAAVDEGRSVEDVIPVNAPTTQEYADMLRSRLDFLEGEILEEE